MRREQTACGGRPRVGGIRDCVGFRMGVSRALDGVGIWRSVTRLWSLRLSRGSLSVYRSILCRLRPRDSRLRWVEDIEFALALWVTG